MENIKNIIEFSDFEKLDLRVAQIKQVEDIEGADKLYKLTINVGEELGERVICAGIKQHYSKEELQDKQIIIIANLAPRKLKGIESKGMLLAAVSKDNKNITLISPDKNVDAGLNVS